MFEINSINHHDNDHNPNCQIYDFDQEIQFVKLMKQSKPKRLVPDELPSTGDKLYSMIDIINQEEHYSNKAFIPSEPWTLACSMQKGYVREKNEDYGWCFQMGDQQIAVLADGCGGIPHGQTAAYLAVVSATAYIMSEFSDRDWASCHDLQYVAEASIFEAAYQLALFGDKYNLAKIQDGLRTTLIVVIADKKDIGYAYIGDGGGYVIHKFDDITRFLKPQKAQDLGLNVLAGSLGPVTINEPISGVIERKQGYPDLILVGTDGLFDRVNESFVNDVMRCCLHYQGDLLKTTQHIVNESASYQDKAGYVFDDNLTLALMGNRIHQEQAEDLQAPPLAQPSPHQDHSHKQDKNPKVAI